jgi:hypothetical protein
MMNNIGDRITDKNETIDDIEGPKVYLYKKINPVRKINFIIHKP